MKYTAIYYNNGYILQLGQSISEIEGQKQKVLAYYHSLGNDRYKISTGQ